MKKLTGLGRGLASLIPSKATMRVVSQTKENNVYNVDINQIRPNSAQPRRDFDPIALRELSDSIKKYGILQPIVVAKVSRETPRGLEVSYELVAGERRWRAAKLAGLPHVPVVVRDDADEKRMKLELALVENLQRADLNPIEEAEAYAQLASEFGLSHAEVAKRVGKSRETVSNTLRTLTLPANIKLAIRSGKLERSHARSLLMFKDPDQQQQMFKQLLTGNASVHNLEETARLIRGTRKDPTAANPRFADLQDNLSKNLGTFVSITAGAQGGRIQIKFADLEQLNKIVTTILD